MAYSTSSGLTFKRPAPFAPPCLQGLDKETLLQYYDSVWALSNWLMGSITGDGTLFRRADPLRHPLIFYLGHTAAFYINKLQLAGVSIQVNPHLQELFAVGVDPSKAKDLATPDWPTEAQAWSFRETVHGLVRDWLEATPCPAEISQGDVHWALLMGLEHDLLHFETSSVLIRQYPVNELTRPEGWTYAPLHGAAPRQQWIAVPAGSVTLGKPPEIPTFGWDNEYGRLDVAVDRFEISNLLVTNREFAEFVADGGYRNPELWTAKGWAWVSEHHVRHPRFWVEDGKGFRYRAMFDEFEMPEDWPVEVNCHEAMAYCRYRGDGYRLLTEAEFRLMSDEGVAGDVLFSSGRNLNLAYGSPCTVGSMSSATSPRGVHDARGNVWCWIADDFYPLPGFKTHPLYEDFSAPFFTPDHGMMAGGAWATVGTAASTYYRLWFRRKFYQHAGFRLAKD